MNNDRPDRCVTQQAQFMAADKRYKKKKKNQREINTRSGLTLCLDIILFHHSAMAGRHQQLRENNPNLNRSCELFQVMSCC